MYRTIWKLQFGKLQLINRGYGIDYYWGERWLFVSALTYIGFPLSGYNKTNKKVGCFHLRNGLMLDGKMYRPMFRDRFQKWLNMRIKSVV